MININTQQNKISTYFDELVYTYYKDKKKNPSFFQNKVDNILYAFNEDTKKNAKDITFWYGYTGILYLLDYFHDQNLIKKGDFSTYTKLLCNSITELYLSHKINNHRWYDLFCGVGGISLYLFKHINDPLVYKKLEEIASYFCIETDKLFLNINDSHFFIKPESYIDQNIKNDFKNGYIDLGAAHGIIIIIYFFKKMYNITHNCKYFDKAKQLINFYIKILNQNKKGYILKNAKYGQSINNHIDTIMKWGNSTFAIVIYLMIYANDLNLIAELSNLKKLYQNYGITLNLLPNDVSISNGLAGTLLLLKRIDILLPNNMRNISNKIILQIEKKINNTKMLNNRTIMTGYYGVNIVKQIRINNIDTLIYNILLLN